MHCVIFTGGEFPLEKSFVSHFLHEVDYVIAADSGLHVCEQFDFQPNCILGDFDSINPNLLQKYPTNIIHSFDTEKDFSDTELALFEAKKNQASFITLIGGGGGRIDHLLSILELFLHPLSPNIWLTQYEAIIHLQAKKTLKIHNLSLNDTISVFPTKKDFQASDYKIISHGLFWPLSMVDWKAGVHSLSNKIENDFFEAKKSVDLYVESGQFIVIVPHTAVVSFA
ncbi:MAG: thiamine diphosphokinase [Treponemataceae bacterium]